VSENPTKNTFLICVCMEHANTFSYHFLSSIRAICIAFTLFGYYK
jgi:hypothetical protein